MNLSSDYVPFFTTIDLHKKKLLDLTLIDPRTISRWRHSANPPSEGSVLKIYRVTGCSFDWLMHGKGEMFLKGSSDLQQPERKTIDLSHGMETFTYSEMVTMTTKVLEPNTVYTAALASNIRALYKAVFTEEEMKSGQNEMTEMRADIQELKELVLSLGAKLPEKRDNASNS